MPHDPRALEKVKRLDFLRSTRGPHEWAIQEISDLMMPFRGDIQTARSPGGTRINRATAPVFDPTAMESLDSFVNFLKGALFPSSVDWLSLHARGERELDRSLQEALDITSERLLQYYSESNMYVTANPFLRDFAGPGNATMFVQHDSERTRPGKPFGGYSFEAVPISRIWWQFSQVGRPLIVVREMELPAIDAAAFFGDDPGFMAQKFMSEGRPFDLVIYHHFVEKNPNPGKPWTSCWVTDEGQESQIVREGFFEEIPYICARWLVVDGEQYGRGRGHVARPSAKGLNQLQMEKLVALGKEINPPFMAEDDTIIELDVTPNGFITIRPPQQIAPAYLRSGTDFGAVEQIIRTEQQVLRRIFFADQLGEPETQDRSAEATRLRRERIITALSAVSETVEHEVLKPMVKTSLNIGLQHGGFPELEEALRDGPAEIEPVFTSPFFTSQKATSVARVHQFLDRRLELAERSQDPAWLDDLDPDRVREFEQRMVDLPIEIFRDESVTEARRQARGDAATLDRLQELAGGRARATRGPRGASQGSLGGGLSGAGA